MQPSLLFLPLKKEAVMSVSCCHCPTHSKTALVPAATCLIPCSCCCICFTPDLDLLRDTSPLTSFTFFRDLRDDNQQVDLTLTSLARVLGAAETSRRKRSKLEIILKRLNSCLPCCPLRPTASQLQWSRKSQATLTAAAGCGR